LRYGVWGVGLNHSPLTIHRIKGGFMGWFILGLISGGFIGMLLTAIFTISRIND